MVEGYDAARAIAGLALPNVQAADRPATAQDGPRRDVVLGVPVANDRGDRGPAMNEQPRKPLRGFGLTVTAGKPRGWYVGFDGVRRWADNDQPCATTMNDHGQDAKTYRAQKR